MDNLERAALYRKLRRLLEVLRELVELGLYRRKLPNEQDLDSGNPDGGLYRTDDYLAGGMVATHCIKSDPRHNAEISLEEPYFAAATTLRPL